MDVGSVIVRFKVLRAEKNLGLGLWMLFLDRVMIVDGGKWEEIEVGIDGAWSGMGGELIGMPEVDDADAVEWAKECLVCFEDEKVKEEWAEIVEAEEEADPEEHDWESELKGSIGGEDDDRGWREEGDGDTTWMEVSGREWRG